MQDRKEPDQLELFEPGSLRLLCPDDYILARVYSVFHLSSLASEFAIFCRADSGNSSSVPPVDIGLKRTKLDLTE